MRRDVPRLMKDAVQRAEKRIVAMSQFGSYTDGNNRKSARRKTHGFDGITR